MGPGFFEVFDGATLILVAGLAVVLVLQLVIFMRCYRRVRPGQALVIYGGGAGQRPRVRLSGGALVVPILQKAEVLSLAPVGLSLRDLGVRTRDGQRFLLDGAAQVRIPPQDDAILAAAERFLGQGPEAIQAAARPVLEGQLRQCIANLDARDAERWLLELEAFVREGVRHELEPWGLELVHLSVKELRAQEA